MADSPIARTWTMRSLYVGLTMVIIFAQMLPLETVPRRVVMPDLMLALTLCWAARRPEFVPVLLIAAMFLLADMLFQRPPGLWTGLVLIFTETLRARAQGLRGLTFPLEWTSIALGLAALYLVNRFAVTMTMLPPPPLVPYFVQMMATILIYPVIAGISHLTLGISRPAPGAVDAFGNRI